MSAVLAGLVFGAPPSAGLPSSTPIGAREGFEKVGCKRVDCTAVQSSAPQTLWTTYGGAMTSALAVISQPAAARVRLEPRVSSRRVVRIRGHPRGHRVSGGARHPTRFNTSRYFLPRSANNDFPRLASVELHPSPVFPVPSPSHRRRALEYHASRSRDVLAHRR